MECTMQYSHDRVTILADSFDEAAYEFHRRKMAQKGYSLEHRIKGHQYYMSVDNELVELFDGQVKYAVTFIKNEEDVP